MKKNILINGVPTNVEMTAEEIAELQSIPQPSVEDRKADILAEMERLMNEYKALGE